MFRRYLKTTPKITIHSKTYNSLDLMNAFFGKKASYSYGLKGDWGRNRQVRKVELLIKQAGMIPFYDLKNEVQRFTVLDKAYQHHINFDSVSTDTHDLILLGKLHSSLTDLEPFKPPEYSQIMSEFRDDFENLKPFRDWSPALKLEYNQRLKKIAEDWSQTGEIPSLGITIEWLESVSPKTFTVRLLDGRIVGEVNYLTDKQLKDVITRQFSMSQFIDYLVSYIARELEI